MMRRFLVSVGGGARDYVESIGLSARTFFTMLGLSPGLLRRPRLLVEQLHVIGNYSLLIIILSGLFVGMVLGLQGYYTLNKYGASESLGLLVALGLTRELGPVITALLFAGRAGTSLTAEIGLMKAVNPIQRVLAPRFWAGVISVPLLTAMFSAVGILGGYLIGVELIGVDEGVFWSQMQGGVDVWKDVFNGFVKSVVFGIAITFIALYQGYEAQPTPEDVSGATTRTVVISSLMIWWLDFMLTALMFSK
jgi:phospholipid/cholesterol/gamma-HCH transport system permease protein